MDRFPFGMGREGRQEEAAAGRALNTERFLFSKGNDAATAGRCKSVCLSVSEVGMNLDLSFVGSVR